MSGWKNRFAFFEVGSRRFGFEKSRVEHGGVPYLDRYILYVGGPTLRLHKFWRGDDDRAFHDHPWTFWTFPLTSYVERVSTPFMDFKRATARETATSGALYTPIEARHVSEEIVRAWRLHNRPATYQHIVIGRLDGSKKPFWTFVISTNYQRRWGFWPRAGEFVPWRDWPSTAEQIDIRAQRPHA
jgi:hypothetical protein